MTIRKHPERQCICDLSGAKYPRSQMRKMWNGLLVHKSEWEPRQPQDYIPPVRNKNNVKDARPDSPPVFITQTDPSVLG